MSSKWMDANNAAMVTEPLNYIPVDVDAENIFRSKSRYTSHRIYTM
jgi:hypothetical protein